MTELSLIQSKSERHKSHEINESFKQLEEISRNWFQSIEDFLGNTLNKKFDILSERIKQNIDLLEEIEDKQQNKFKDIISKSNLNIDNKASNELNETDLTNELNRLKSLIESLSSELVTKKDHKMELTLKTKALTKQLEEMENRVQEFKQNKSNESNEYLTLASVMRVMYKTWNNSKVIGLLFNDNEEKSLDRLIVIDRENKSEQQMAQQFWESIEKDYKINQ